MATTKKLKAKKTGTRELLDGQQRLWDAVLILQRRVHKNEDQVRALRPQINKPEARSLVDKDILKQKRREFYQKKVDEMRVLRDEINYVSGDLGRWRRNRQRLGLETKSLDAAVEVLDKLANIAWEMNNPEEAMKKGKSNV